MTQSLQHGGTEFEGDSFVQGCSYCGARFEVFVSSEGDSGEHGDYRCPECTKRYIVRGALDPEVRLLARRTDGKTDPYSETMF